VTVFPQVREQRWEVLEGFLEGKTESKLQLETTAMQESTKLFGSEG